MTVPPLLWVPSFCLRPIADVLLQLLVGVGVADIVHSWNLDNYRQLLRVDVYWQTLLRSMWIAARVTLFSLLLAIRWRIFCRSTPGREKICSINW